MTDRRFAALDLGPLPQRDPSEVSDETELEILYRHNATIANAATNQDPDMLLGSAKRLRSYEWQRMEYTLAAGRMADSAEMLANDILSFQLGVKLR